MHICIHTYNTIQYNTLMSCVFSVVVVDFGGCGVLARVPKNILNLIQICSTRKAFCVEV